MRKNKLNLYQLESQDLTTLYSMGSIPRTNWVKYFTTVEAAKRYAEKDYKKEAEVKKPEKIEWSREGKSRWCTQDLRFVMYEISEIEVEKE